MDIFLDYDGTIINPFRRIYTIYQDLTKKYTLSHLSYEEYIAYKRNHIPEVNLLGNCSESIKQTYQTERMNLIEDPYYLALDTLYPHTKEVLQKLQTVHTLHLISIRKRRELLIKQLKEHSLMTYFRSVNSPSKENLDKEPLHVKLLLISSIKAEHNKQVVVGDTEVDILLGKKLGAITIASNYGMRENNYLLALEPNYIITDISELPQKLM